MLQCGRKLYYMYSAMTGLRRLTDLDAKQRLLTPDSGVTAHKFLFSASPALLASSQFTTTYILTRDILSMASSDNRWYLGIGRSSLLVNKLRNLCPASG